MASRALRRAARASREHVRRELETASRRDDYATVREVDPVKAELHSTGAVLEAGEDLVLGQWVRKYHARWELEPGDALAVRRGPDDDWIAYEVLADKDMPED